MQPDPSAFSTNARLALDDTKLQQALGKLQGDFRRDRASMLSRLPEFEALRDQARTIKDHALDHLDGYLEQFEERVASRGGAVHWCEDAAAARETILRLCHESGGSRIVKGKSMLS